jgi:hypothetical protein
MEKNNLEERYAIMFCIKLPVPTKRFRKRLVMILCHVLKYFGGEKRWKMNRHLDAPPL